MDLRVTTPKFLPYGRQNIDESDIAAVVEALRSNFLTTGPLVDRFEAALAEKVGGAYAVAVSNGTAALHVACIAAGCTEGQTWIVPSITFVATANAVRFCGGEVWFADTDPETGLMRPSDLETAIHDAEAAGQRVAGVLPVHLGGQVVDMPRIAELAKAHNLIVIEDASHAIGSRCMTDGQETRVGACAHSDICIFSMHPVKTIAMGEGGAVVTNDERIAERAAQARSHGLTRAPEQFRNRDMAFGADGGPNPWYYEQDMLGYNYRETDLHCALGLSQLTRLDEFVARRAELRARYHDKLGPHAPLVQMVPERGGQRPAWHLATALIDFERSGRDRSAVMTDLREKGIGTQVHYIPVHMQPYYRDRYGAHELAGAEAYYGRCLSLPLYMGLEEADQDRVIKALTQAVGG